jgi:tetratricopeptide (TPR) repeat protein
MKFVAVAVLAGLVMISCASIPESVRLAQEAFSHIKLGDDAAGRGDIDTAIMNYEKALEMTPRAPKWRIMYAQFLYLKGLSFDVASHSSLHKTFGNYFDADTGKWRKLEEKLSEEQSKKELEVSAEFKQKALTYFNKAIIELRRCDIEFNFAEDRVPEAMALVFIMKEEFDNAKIQLRRLLESSRVRDSYKDDIRKVIVLMGKHQREMERQKPAEGMDDFGP